MTVVLPFIIIAILILINGLFVASEFAIIGIRPTRIQQLAREGNRTAQWLEGVVTDSKKVDQYIATSQLGITLASLGLGMYAEPAIAHLLEEPLHAWFGIEGAATHSISFVIALSLITYLHVVIGEMVPKSLALQNAEMMVLRLATPMQFAEKLFALPVRFLNWIGRVVLMLLRLPPPAEGQHFYTPYELQLIVSESRAEGLVEEREQELIDNIFDFAGRSVVDMMTPRTLMRALPVTISKEALLETLDTTPHSRLPIYEDSPENIIGMLHLKDFVRQHLAGKPYDLRDLVRQVPFVPETQPAEMLLDTFKRLHLHMAIVIDEHGSTAGLVTLEDLLEEVIGEMFDEFDNEAEWPLVLSEPGHLVAQGTVRLDDIEEYVSLGEHGHDVRTIGGLALSALGRPPLPGDEVTIGKARIVVSEIEGMTILHVDVYFTPEGPSEQA